MLSQTQGNFQAVCMVGGLLHHLNSVIIDSLIIGFHMAERITASIQWPLQCSYFHFSLLNYFSLPDLWVVLMGFLISVGKVDISHTCYLSPVLCWSIPSQISLKHQAALIQPCGEPANTTMTLSKRSNLQPWAQLNKTEYRGNCFRRVIHGTIQPALKLLL